MENRDDGMSDNKRQSRGFLMTMNNPDDEKYEGKYQFETVRKTIEREFKCFEYLAWAKEIGERGTEHVHWYMRFNYPIRWAKVKKIWGEPNILPALGTPIENRNYIFKLTEKHKDKEYTSIKDSFREFGKPPLPNKEKKKSTMILVDEAIREGKTADEIIREFPKLRFQRNKIEQEVMRELQKKVKDKYIDRLCIYIHGLPRTGKTRFVRAKYGTESTYFVSNYGSGAFDGYSAFQDTIVLDEFRGELSIDLLLKLADNYNFALPARYSDKYCNHKVLIVISNESFNSLYPEIQESRPATWRALKARFDLEINFNDFLGSDFTFNEKYLICESLVQKTLERKARWLVEANQVSYYTKKGYKVADRSLLESLIEQTFEQSKPMYMLSGDEISSCEFK